MSDCPDGLNDWSAQDKAAFRDYLRQRVAGYLAAQLDEAMKQFAALSKAFIKKVEEAWLRAGVHPSQEPGWDDRPRVRTLTCLINWSLFFNVGGRFHRGSGGGRKVPHGGAGNRVSCR